MNNDKELVEVWRKEFIKLAKSECDTEICSNGIFLSRHAELMFYGFLLGKRTQPSVVLPDKGLNRYNDDVYDAEEIHDRLTAAGIKYTIGE